jgi:hypothetical protein
MNWIEIAAYAIAIAFGWMWISWKLRPSISPAAVTDQLVAVTQPVTSTLRALLEGMGPFDREAVGNEVVALAFVTTCWGVQMGGGGYMLRQDQCARLSVLFEQQLSGFETSADRRVFFNKLYASYARSDDHSQSKPPTNKAALFRHAAELMLIHFEMRSKVRLADTSGRRRLVDEIAGALKTTREIWSKAIALYKVR